MKAASTSSWLAVLAPGSVAGGGRRRPSRAAGVLIAVASWLAAGACAACMSPPHTPIREQLQSANRVLIIQVQSAELVVDRLGPRLAASYLSGRVSVVETMKGPKGDFTRFELNLGCNDLRMDVGDYFLLATNQDGELLTMGGANATVMFLSPDHPSGPRPDSLDLRVVREFLNGKPLPADFGRHAAPMTSKYHLPPPCERFDGPDSNNAGEKP